MSRENSLIVVVAECKWSAYYLVLNVFVARVHK